MTARYKEPQNIPNFQPAVFSYFYRPPLCSLLLHGADLCDCVGLSFVAALVNGGTRQRSSNSDQLFSANRRLPNKETWR